MAQYARNSVRVCILLLLFLVCPAVAGYAFTPSTRQQEEQSIRRAKQIHFFLHIVGVVLAGSASAARVSYPPSICMDYIMTCSFYTCVAGFLAISLYLTYQFESPDMLLIGAAAGVIVAWRSIPRLWSITARRLHWEAPMWRTRDGNIYKRVRRERPPNDGATEYWNGYQYDSMLIDGHPISELVEKDPYHWEKAGSHWKGFVIRGRLGDEAARRAALAWRMAYTIPSPAMIPCGKSEYFASKGALGVEVAHTWDIKPHDMRSYRTLLQKDDRGLTECDCRNELAVLLHLKMLLHGAEDNGREADWTEFATDWLFGEMVTSRGAPLEGVLACGVLACGKPSPDSTMYWNFVAKNHPRVEEVRRERERERDRRLCVAVGV